MNGACAYGADEKIDELTTCPSPRRSEKMSTRHANVLQIVQRYAPLYCTRVILLTNVITLLY